MKKTTITLTTLAIVAIFICIFISLSCHKKCNPDSCYLTESEKNFFSCYYNNAENVLFKNDSTNDIETLIIPGGCLMVGPGTICPEEDITNYSALSVCPA